MIVVIVVLVAQRVFASHKQCECTDSYRRNRHLQRCGAVYVLHHEHCRSQDILGMPSVGVVTLA